MISLEQVHPVMESVVEVVIETIESDSRFHTDEQAQHSVTKIKEAWALLDAFIAPDKFRLKHREFSNE